MKPNKVWREEFDKKFYQKELGYLELKTFIQETLNQQLQEIIKLNRKVYDPIELGIRLENKLGSKPGRKI